MDWKAEVRQMSLRSVPELILAASGVIQASLAPGANIVLQGIYYGEDDKAHKTEDNNSGIHILVVHPHPGVHDKVAHPIFGAESFGKKQNRNGCSQGQAGGSQNIG